MHLVTFKLHIIEKHPIILFDGICNLCNASVQMVIRHDKKKLFRFASLQSAAGQSLLVKYHLPANNFNSFVLVEDDRAFTSSTAALKVARQLSGPLKLLYGFIIAPAFIRNAVYRLIASNRYRWFGKRESCMLPTPELQSRFLK